jgi:hypothetical protein
LSYTGTCVPTPIDRALVALNLSHVRRWVIAPMKRDLSVGDHVYRSMVILKYLFEAMYRRINVPDEEPVFHQTMLLLLMHDVPESFSGDIPAPFKRVTPELYLRVKEAEDLICPEVKEVVDSTDVLPTRLASLCDLIECYTWYKMFGPDFWPHPWAENRGYIMRQQVEQATEMISSNYIGWEGLPKAVDLLLDHLTPAAREKDTAAPSLAKNGASGL